MSYLPRFTQKDILGPYFFPSISGCAFDSISGALVRNAASAPGILEVSKDFGTYGWMEVDIQNLGVALELFSIRGDDSIVGESANYFQWDFNIPAGFKLTVTLPSIATLRKLTLSSPTVRWQITAIRVYTLPFVPDFVGTAWGQAEGITAFPSGNILTSGWTGKIHHWSVNTGFTGGMSYTVLPASVQDSDWYTFKVTAIPAPILAGFLGYVCKGEVTFIWTGPLGFFSPAGSMTNTSGIAQTNYFEFIRHVFNPNTNAWQYQNTVGA